MNEFDPTSVFDRPIAFNRGFVNLDCGITGALLLSQAVYWSKRTPKGDGWFYKTAAEWEEETGLSRREQETARSKLRDCGVLLELKKGLPCKTYFYIDFPILFQLCGFSHTGLHESAKPGATNEPNRYGVMRESSTETTTETTADTQEVSAEPKPSKYKYEDIDLDFSKQMYQRILELNATYKEPNYKAWANTVRLARDQDKRSIDDLWDVFDWANRDSFWQANILSPKKLRDKFDDLVIKMNSSKNSPAPIQSAEQGNTDWAENIGQPYLPNETNQGLINHEQ